MFNFVITYGFGTCQRLGQSYLQFPATRAELQLYAEGRSAGLRRRERMRWIRYEANGQPVYGIVEGDTVTEVRGDPFAGYEKTTTRRPLSSVKLLVPVEP